MKRALVLIAIVGLGSCADPESAYVDNAKRAVAQKLRDPASAQFRNVHYRRADTGAHVVCGEVNGRNGYGGYVGFQDFIWHSGNVEMSAAPGDQAFSRRQLEICI